MTKTESFLRLYILGGNPFARIECQKLTRNEVRVSKTEGFCDFTFSAATLSYEMRFECQKLKVFCDFGWSGGNAFAVCVKVCRSICVKVKAFLCKRVCASKRLCVKAFVCRSVCVCASVCV